MNNMRKDTDRLIVIRFYKGDKHDFISRLVSYGLEVTGNPTDMTHVTIEVCETGYDLTTTGIYKYFKKDAITKRNLDRYSVATITLNPVNIYSLALVETNIEYKISEDLRVDPMDFIDFAEGKGKPYFCTDWILDMLEISLPISNIPGLMFQELSTYDKLTCGTGEYAVYSAIG